jgi:hypothetical protein
MLVGAHQCAGIAGQEIDIPYLAAFHDPGIFAAGIADQDFVEFGSAYLVGHGHGFVHGVGKFEGLLVVVPRRYKLGAPLFHADGLDGIRHAQLVEQGQIRGEQGFADVKTRVMRFFQQGDAVTALAQQGGGG